MLRIFLPVLAATFILAACNNAGTDVETVEAKATEPIDTTAHIGQKLAIYTSSSIRWTGSKTTGEHSGTFKVKEGNLIVDDSTISGGTIIIDMQSLTNTDLNEDAENKVKLETHLKSPDFFNVMKYPTAKFIISKVEPYVADSTGAPPAKGATHTITGNLTLTDQTQSISFPATIKVDDKGVKANADFNIDRTQWGLNYKGPNNPQDWFISKTVNLKLNVFAAK